jgi:hypothetical protein
MVGAFLHSAVVFGVCREAFAYATAVITLAMPTTFVWALHLRTVIAIKRLLAGTFASFLVTLPISSTHLRTKLLGAIFLHPASLASADAEILTDTMPTTILWALAFATIHAIERLLAFA